MKKPNCKCGDRMELASQGVFDTSTWKSTKRTKIKAKPVYRITFTCRCENFRQFTGTSRRDTLRRVNLYNWEDRKIKLTRRYVARVEARMSLNPQT